MRIGGHDGKELIEKFSAEFNVNMNGFNWVEYFGEEGVRCLPISLIGWIIDLFRREKNDSKDILIKDLVKWAEEKTWSE